MAYLGQKWRVKPEKAEEIKQWIIKKVELKIRKLRVNMKYGELSSPMLHLRIIKLGRCTVHHLETCC